MTNMVSSGSKGSPLNVSQMISCLGQQNVDGKKFHMVLLIEHYLTSKNMMIPQKPEVLLKIHS